MGSKPKAGQAPDDDDKPRTRRRSNRKGLAAYRSELILVSLSAVEELVKLLNHLLS